MKYIITFLLLSIALQSQGQTITNEEQSIKSIINAKAHYEDGEFDTTISMLGKLLNNRFSHLDKEDKIDAYELLILCYLSIDYPEEAHKAVKEIFKIDPLYKPNIYKNDNRLVALFDEYYTKPVYSVGIDGGINYPLINRMKQYSIVYNNGEAPDAYESKTGAQIGVNFEYRISERMWLRLASVYQSSRYEHILYNVVNETINYKEALYYVNIPVSIKYYIFKNNFQPYFFAGGDITYLSLAESTTFNKESTDIVNRNSLRNSLLPGLFGGIGIRYKYKIFAFSLDARYGYYFDNLNKTGTRYNDKINLYYYYYVDDDIKLNYLKLNAGISVFFKYKIFRNK